MTVPMMVDLSSNNPTPDLAAHWRGGFRVLALKATEGTGYTWTGHRGLADAWHRLGGVVWHYHFLTPGDGAAQADHFCATVGASGRHGDRIVVDVETQNDTGAEVSAFIARCATHTALPGVVYGSPYFLRDHGIRPSHGWGLWLADYDSKIAFVPPGWSSWLAWQYTDRATGVPGIAGAVDCSHLSAAAMPSAPPSGAPAWYHRVLRLSSPMLHGDDVKVVQRKVGVAADGWYGSATRNAVVRWQTAHRLAADGAVGPATSRAMGA